MTTPSLNRPTDLLEYERWLEELWDGDTRELRKGRYLHQQGDLMKAFGGSPFYQALPRRTEEWADQYKENTGFELFSVPRPVPELLAKPWESFLSRTRRENIVKNPNFPEPPAQGWFLPDNWFEKLWDIVRTRYVVRYLDGVEWLAARLVEHAEALNCSVRRKTHAQDRGYYAVHVLVSQPFLVQTLDFNEEQERTSTVEIQITTQLQEVIGQLTHRHFERARDEDPPSDSDPKWQWDYESPQFTPYYLGHLLHYLEGMIMRIRSEGKDSE